MDSELISVFKSIVFSATPFVIAGVGETITERSGIVNLSLDGSIAMAAMVGFVVSLTTGNIALGMIAAMLVGGLVALFVAYSTIELKLDQITVGFVLTILMADLAQFLGQSYARQPGVRTPKTGIPLLSDIPVAGEVFFNQDVFVYISLTLLVVAWYWLFKTRYGLELRSVGERPEAAFARGLRVNRIRYIYTVVGGCLVGLAGASYSLSVKAGWATPPSMRGDGWIVLAIVIFAGWHPFRVALGAYMFAALGVASARIQRDPNINFPFVLLNTLPWLMMLFTLAFVNNGVLQRILSVFPGPVRGRLREILRTESPAALGVDFISE